MMLDILVHARRVHAQHGHVQDVPGVIGMQVLDDALQRRVVRSLENQGMKFVVPGHPLPHRPRGMPVGGGAALVDFRI
ncbi:hypothetical protein G6F24_016835 [Rhizopus arrhizus]|nr:hypothetical protein G6F24_016835 [Rhizopus arrhizus]